MHVWGTATVRKNMGKIGYSQRKNNSKSEESKRKVSETCRDQKGHIWGCLWKWSLVGLYAELLTVLDTKSDVVTLGRGGLGGGEERRRWTAYIVKTYCFYCQLISIRVALLSWQAGHGRLLTWALHQTQVVCCGPPAVTSGSVEDSQL